MFQIQDIDHIVLRVSDLERMIDFYCKVLGCSLEWRRPDLGLVHLRAGSAMIDLVPVDGKLGSVGGAAPGKEGRNMDHVCLRVQPVRRRRDRAAPRVARSAGWRDPPALRRGRRRRLDLCLRPGGQSGRVEGRQGLGARD